MDFSFRLEGDPVSRSKLSRVFRPSGERVVIVARLALGGVDTTRKLELAVESSAGMAETVLSMEGEMSTDEMKANDEPAVWSTELSLVNIWLAARTLRGRREVRFTEEALDIGGGIGRAGIG